LKSFSLTNFLRFFGSYLFISIPIFLVSLVLTLFLSWSDSFKEVYATLLNLDSDSSLHIKPANSRDGSVTIDEPTLMKLKEKLGESDNIIRNVVPRANFYGIIKSGSVDSTFTAKGIDPSKDREFITSSINIVSGEFLDTRKRDSILISTELANKLKVKSGDRVDLYTLNRDKNKEKRQEINKITVFVDGVFQSGVERRELIIIPLYLTDTLLKNSNVDEIILNLYSSNDVDRFKEALTPFLEKLNLKVESREEYRHSESLKSSFIIVSALISLLLIFLLYRTLTATLDKRDNDIKTLIHYGWSSNSILSELSKEFIIFSIFITLLNSVVLFASMEIISSLNIVPTLFTNYPVEIELAVNIQDIFIVSGVVGLATLLTSLILVRSRKIDLSGE